MLKRRLVAAAGGVGCAFALGLWMGALLFSESTNRPGRATRGINRGSTCRRQVTGRQAARRGRVVEWRARSSGRWPSRDRSHANPRRAARGTITGWGPSSVGDSSG